MVRVEETLLHGQALAVERSAEAWNGVQVELDTLSHLETTLRMLTPMIRCLLGVFSDFWERLFAGQLRDVHVTGTMLREAADIFVKALEQHEATVKKFEEAGHKVAGAGAFWEATEAMKSVAADLGKSWPRFEDADIDAALERTAQGEFADLSDVYHEFPELQKPAGS